MNDFSTSNFFDLSRFVHSGLFENIDPVWNALSHIESYLRRAQLGINHALKQEYAYLVNVETIYVGEGTIIEPGAYLKGPCIIGKNCHIRHGAYIRGDVITGDRCIIGHDTEIKHSILMDDVQAAHFAYIGDSILGNKVHLGAGVKCANLKLDQSCVEVQNGLVQIKTGLRKLGAILGDCSQIGCNTVLNPGTIVGKQTHCYPCVNLKGTIPSQYIVKSVRNFELIPQKGR